MPDFPKLSDMTPEQLRERVVEMSVELARVRHALNYVDRQVREVWKPEDGYQRVHREWCIEQAAQALKPSS
jgi:hypothetical protein